MTAPRADAASDLGTRRIDGASGIVAGALILAGFVLAGPAPPPSSEASELARHLADHRARIVTGDFLIAIGAVVYIWFLAALRTHLATGARSEPTLSTVAFAGGAIGATLVIAGVALQSALVFSTETLANLTAVRGGFDAYNALITIAGIAFALTVAATSGSATRSGALGPKLRRSGWVVAALQVTTLVGLVVGDGPFAAAAPIPVLAFWALTAWSVAVAVVLMRR